jgi:tetratricopeptide (TPR) repeat protein
MQKRARAFFVVFSTLSLVLVAPIWAPGTSCSAQAQAQAGSSGKDKAARELFNAGRAAYDEGLYEDALASFRRAYELSKRPALLFNIGQAADRARRDREALDAFEQYLLEVPAADNRAFVEGRIAVLKKALEPEQRPAPTETPNLSPSTVTLPPAEPSAPAAAVGSSTADVDDDGSVTSKWWFWTAIGVGAAAIVVTTVVLASGSEDLEQGQVGGVVRTLEVQR